MLILAHCPLGQKKKKGIAQLRARYTNQTILRRNDNLPSPGLEPGSPGRTRTILEEMRKLCQYIEEIFLPAIREGGRGRVRERARTEAPPGAPCAPPLPIRWTFALGHLARPGFPPPLPTVLAKARAGAVACGTRRPHWASGTPNDRTLLGTEWPRGRVWKEKKKKRKRMNVNSEDRERERRASARDRSRGGHRHAVAVADRNDDDDAELFSFASFLSSFFLFMISE